jgi:hypothetical protein
VRPSHSGSQPAAGASRVGCCAGGASCTADKNRCVAVPVVVVVVTVVVETAAFKGTKAPTELALSSNEAAASAQGVIRIVRLCRLVVMVIVR